MNKKEIINEAKKVLNIEIKGIKTIVKSFDNNFYNIVKIMYQTKGRVIVTGIGKSGHIANKISATLSSTGTASHFIHATEASHGDLGAIKKTDCILAISNSGQTHELNNILNYAKRFNIPLLSISSNKNSLLYKKSDHGIIFKKPLEACPHDLAPTTSTSMTLIIGDAISMALLKIKGFKKIILANFTQVETLAKILLELIQ